jgi:hypothetical protein
VLKGAYRWSADHDAFLDFDGTGDDSGEIEAAEGLMDEVEGWAEAYSKRRTQAVAEMEPTDDHRDGGTGDPPRTDNPMDIAEPQGPQATTNSLAPVVKQEKEVSRSKKTSAVPKRKPLGRKNR